MSSRARTIVILSLSLLISSLGGCLPMQAPAPCFGRTIEGRETHFMELAHGNGEFVMADGNGGLYFSRDGQTWGSSSGLGTGLFGLSYGKDQFMAAPRCGGIYISKDTIKWRRVIPKKGEYFHKWIFDGEHLLLSGASGGVVLRSKNGTKWETADVGTEYSLLGLTKGSGLYVAVGRYGSIYTSPDWRNWTQEESSIWAETLRRVIYEDGLFVAVGEKGVITTSADGKHWERRESGMAGTLLNIAYGDGRFVAVGDAVLTSTDGHAWEITWQSDQPERFLAWDVAYGNGRFVVAADQRTVLISEDGFDWQEVKVPLESD